MTQRTTFTIEAQDSITQGIPTISHNDANATVSVDAGGVEKFWRGVTINHKPQPGYATTSAVSIIKQSDNTTVASTTTTGTLDLYYPNHPEYGNSSLPANQGSMEWDTHYFMQITNASGSAKRENVAIRKIIL
jgi:hypothetical protein